MRYLQQFFTYLILTTFCVTNITPSALADEDVTVHSLDELPSFQMDTISQAIESEEKTISYEASAPNEDIMSLIAAKQSFEAEQKKAIIEVPSIASILEQNTNVWGVGQSSITDSFLAPVTETKTFFPALDFRSTQSGGIFDHSSLKSFRVPKESKLGEGSHGKFAKNPAQVKIAPETIVTAANGTLIDPATIGLYEVDSAIMSKANSYHDKKMKKKGTKAK